MTDLTSITQEDDLDFFRIDEGLLANKRKRENSIHFIEDQIKASILEVNKRKTEAKTYEYGYKIFLNNYNEDGFIEDFLGLDIGNLDDKNVKEGNELFNFGLNQEKWVKLLNKSILMHYERHLIEKAIQAKSKNVIINQMGGFNMNMNMNMSMINPLNRQLNRFPVPNFPNNHNIVNNNPAISVPNVMGYGINASMNHTNIIPHSNINPGINYNNNNPQNVGNGNIVSDSANGYNGIRTLNPINSVNSNYTSGVLSNSTQHLNSVPLNANLTLTNQTELNNSIQLSNKEKFEEKEFIKELNLKEDQ
jgi:hypothetical protein